MSSPGGREVGRVSIRVLPDTSGFRRDLQRELDEVERTLELTVPVNFDVDTAELRAQLEGINARVTVPVDFDVDIARLRTQIESLNRTRITIPVELDIDTAALRATLANLNATRIDITVRIDGVSLALAELAALEAVVDRLDGRTIRIQVDMDSAAALAQIAALEAALAALRGSIGSIGSGGGGLGGGGGGAGLGGMIGSLIQAGALASALAVAGAGVTVAWGLAATAIAAIPAALFLVAGPIGAIALGMDGIKKAAQTLKPEIDKLKTAVENSFEKSFTKAFTTIKPIFPAIQAGMVGIADAVGFIANSVAGMITDFEVVETLQDVFANIAGALRAMAPGINDVLVGLLNVGSQSGVFDALTTAVNTFGREFKKSVHDEIADGTLAAAFKGFEGVLASLTTGFVQLVDNGIRVFAAAAPGVKSFLDDLTGFFERFDFAKLGAAAGSVFEGLGEALRGVDTGTIRGIEDAFTRLGDVFKDKSFQADIQSIVDGLPAAIDTIKNFTTDFAGIASGIADGLKAFDTIDQRVRDFVTTTGDSFARLGEVFGAGDKAPWTAALTDFDDSIDRALGIIPPKAEQLGAETGARGARGTASGFAEMQGAATAGTAGVATATEQGLGGVAPAAAAGLATLSPTAVAIFNQLAPDIETAMAGLSLAAQIGMTTVAQGLTTGGAGLGEALRAVLTGLGPIVTQAFAALAAPAELGMAALTQGVVAGTLGLQTALATGLTGLGPVAAAGMTAAMAQVADAATTGVLKINDLFIKSQQVWTAAITLSGTSMAIGATTALDAVYEAFDAGLTGVTDLISQFGQLWVNAIAVGVDVMAQQVTASLAGVSEAFTTGFTGIGPAIQAAFVGLGINVAFGMATLAQAVTLGMVPVADALAMAFAALPPVVNAGMMAMEAAVIAGFVPVALAFVNGFAQITGELVAAKFIELNGTVSRGMTGMAATITNSLFGIAEVFTAAFNNLVPSTQTGIDGVKAAVEAGLAAVSESIAFYGQQWVNQLSQITGLLSEVATTDFQTFANGIDGALQGLTDTVQFNMDAMVAVITTALAQVPAISIEQMAAAVSAITGAAAQITSVMQTAMTDLNAAVQAGMTQASTAISGGVAGMVAVLNGAVGQFRTAGSNMGAALAEGLRSQLGAVQAAANALAQAAAAATRAAAQIHSPSRVFMNLGDLMGQGLAVGLDQSQPRLIAAAKSIVDGLSTEFGKADTQLPDPGLGQWGKLDGKVRASTAEVNSSIVGSVGGQTATSPQVSVVVNNPIAERASDSFSRKLRDLADLGVLAGA